MEIYQYRDRHYQVDFVDFLMHSYEWDENFAEGMAAKVNIPEGLTEAHWKVIRSIRDYFKKYGVCPSVYQACRVNDLRLKGLRELFPTGYQRGACKLAGLTYREGFLGYRDLPESADELTPLSEDKSYLVDVRGFLMDPATWDKTFAIFKAHELKMQGKMGEQHWQVIEFIRGYWEARHEVPTVYDTCEANHLEIEELEQLFPDGYHRGAVKIAGLRFR